MFCRFNFNKYSLFAWACVIVALLNNPGDLAYSDEAMQEAEESYANGDYQQALEIWLLKAYEGDPKAQFLLGKMFADGTGTVVDPAESVYWYSRSAEQGNSDAQFELGNAYFHGAGLAADKKSALQWWQLAAGNDHVNAQYHLGRAYFYGINLTQNSDQAIEWFNKAAANGSELAINFLNRIGDNQGHSSEKKTSDWRGFGAVGDNAIRIYSYFNRHSSILQSLQSGSLVRVLDQNSGWFRVEVPGGVPIWIPRDSIGLEGDVSIINRPGVAARPDPLDSPENKPLGVLQRGDQVVILERRKEWVKVQAPQHISGWVEAINITEIDSDEDEMEGPWQDAIASRFAELNIISPTLVLNSSENDSKQENSGSTDNAQEPADTSGEIIEVVDPLPPTDDGVLLASVTDLSSEPISEQTEIVENESLADTRSDEVNAEKETDNAEVSSFESVDFKSLGQQDWWVTRAESSSIKDAQYLRVGPVEQSVFTRNRLSSASIVSLAPGNLVQITGRRGNWVRVRVPGGLPLWIFSKFIEHNSVTGTITGQGVRARPLPSTSNGSQPVGNYPSGAEVKVIQEENSWVQIRAPESLQGWMQVEGLYTVAREALIINIEWTQQIDEGPIDSIVVEEAVVSTEPVTNSAQQEPIVSEVTEAESAAAPVEDPETIAEVTQQTTTAEPVEDIPYVENVVEKESSSESMTASQKVEEAEQAEQAIVEIPVAPVTAETDAVTTLVEGEISVDEKISNNDETLSQASISESDVANEGEISEAVNAAEPEQVVTEGDNLGSVTEVVEDLAVEKSDGEQVASNSREVNTGSEEVVSSASSEKLDELLPVLETDAPVENQLAEESESVALIATEAAEESANTAQQNDVTSNDSLQSVVTEGTLEEPLVDVSISKSTSDTGNDSVQEQTAVIDEQPQSESEAVVTEPTAEAVVSGDEATANDSLTPNNSAVNQAPVESVVENATDSLVDSNESIANVQLDEEPIEKPVEEVAQIEASVVTDSITVDDVAEAQSANSEKDAVIFDDLSWLYKQSSDDFSIELLREVDRQAISQAVEKIEAAELLASFSSIQNGEQVYNLLYGVFSDLRHVKQALSDLQTNFSTIRIRRLGAMQDEWCKKLDNLTPEQFLVVLDKCAG